MTSVENEACEIPELLEIPEQDLRLINEIKPYFNKEGNLYVIIAREINYRNGINNGNLRVGILRQSDDSGFELILPFSKNLIYATIKDGIVELAYVEERKLKIKEIPFNSEGKLDFEDYAFLLEPEEQYLLRSRQISR